MARILVVDDELGYTDLLELLLKADGHEVLTTNSAPSAIEIGRWHRPDVLLADWKLKSDLTGLDVARELAGRNEELITVIMSGYSSDMLKSQAPDIRNLYVLEKPFDTEHLQNVIHKATATHAR